LWIVGFLTAKKGIHNRTTDVLPRRNGTKPCLTVVDSTAADGRIPSEAFDCVFTFCCDCIIPQIVLDVNAFTAF
jgi:hypothetical protein